VPLQQLHDDLEKIIPFVNKNEHSMQYCEILFMLGGHVHLPMGDYEKADSYLDGAINLAQQIGSYDLLCRSQRKKAEVLCGLERYEEAATICTKTIQVAEERELWRYAFYLRCVHGETIRLRGKADDALKVFQQEVPTASSLGIKGWIGHTNLSVGNCYADLGDYKKASECYEIANDIYTEIGQKWGSLNVQTAAQRVRLLSTGSADADALNRLKHDADELCYYTLSKRISGLAEGDKSIIRFEFL